jgi:hypothetical protein
VIQRQQEEFMDKNPRQESSGGNITFDYGVPTPIARGVAEAITRTKCQIRDQIAGREGKARLPTVEEVQRIGRGMAVETLAPVRANSGLPIDKWFSVFYGQHFGPYNAALHDLDALYQRWQNDPSLTDELQESLDTLFGHVIEAVVDLIVADCRDDNLVGNKERR